MCLALRVSRFALIITLQFLCSWLAEATAAPHVPTYMVLELLLVLEAAVCRVSASDDFPLYVVRPRCSAFLWGGFVRFSSSGFLGACRVNLFSSPGVELGRFLVR